MVRVSSGVALLTSHHYSTFYLNLHTDLQTVPVRFHVQTLIKICIYLPPNTHKSLKIASTSGPINKTNGSKMSSSLLSTNVVSLILKK